MMKSIGKCVRVVWHWLIAGVLATAMASAGISVLYAQYGDEVNDKPCVDGDCFSTLDKHVTALKLKLTEAD